MIEISKELLNQTKYYFEKGMDKLSEMLFEEDIANSSMIMAAWISAADGTIAPSEVAETERFIKEAEYLKEKNHENLIKEYREWCDNFIKNPEDAVVYALIELAPLINRPEAVNAVQLAYKIAQSDNDFAESELRIITKACHFLKVPCNDE